ncbi:MAG: FHA domain-containing serine/threonine-protein kinase [Pseudomonadota bacterium]
MSHLPPHSELGVYEIIRRVGGGGMAQIYLAKTTGLAGFEKLLALKVINPDYANEERFIQMLIDEAKIVVGLAHINIAQVFDLGQYKGIYYIAMEYVDGCDVLELVNGLYHLGERLPIVAACHVGWQICAGLHYAHLRRDNNGSPLNIVHRDISPQNILVSKAGEVKIVDFGIAKAAGVSTRTQAGVIKGKVNYMAPEQAAGQKVDKQTDVFSTGIVVWEMLTSKMAYSANDMKKLLGLVRKAEIPTPSSVRPEIPEELDRIVMKALARDRKERFQNANEFQVELTKFLASEAPEYGGPDLAKLVERALTDNDASPSLSIEQKHLSKMDRLEDRHSLIFDAQIPRIEKAGLVIKRETGNETLPIIDAVTIGRAGDLMLLDARVSRQHARVFRQDNEYLVEDLGSANGTFVNEKKIHAPQVLRDGDEIRVGKWIIKFVILVESLPPTAKPKLAITCGNQTNEHVMENDVELFYKVLIGTMELQGTAGMLVYKDNEIWLEPEQGRAAITVNGTIPTGPMLFSKGDVIQVAGIIITLAV